MTRYTLMLLAISAATAFGFPSFICTRQPYESVDRDGWGGRPPINVYPIGEPVPYVMIHHTYHPGACFTRETCNAAMIAMQRYHMDTLGYDDIGYSFAVGSDYAVYEGRGWDTVGGHALGYNTNSIGIALIGDYIAELPPPEQLQAVKDLITVGVQLGYIREDYKLIAHRQISNTQCPGDALFAEISTWDHFTSEVEIVDTVSVDHQPHVEI